MAAERSFLLMWLGGGGEEKPRRRKAPKKRREGVKSRIAKGPESLLQFWERLVLLLVVRGLGIAPIEFVAFRLDRLALEFRQISQKRPQMKGEAGARE